MKSTTIPFAAILAYAAAQDAYTTSSATYACNPAHQYPAGQVCTTVSGSLTLVTVSGTATSTPSICNAAAIARGDCTATAASVPTTSATYACKPAHDYGNGASCISTAGSLTLVYPTPSASATYACNPAHDYGNGASCISTAGTLSLVYPTASANATYACNPAHDYGNGASCISTAGTLSLVYPSATGSTMATAPAGNGTTPTGITPYTGTARKVMACGSLVLAGVVGIVSL